ncbi:hypothetical protein L579_0253 [Pantoea sp. AS-PWVM4]|nr:hypothetical protein L579_0253 [Pantoea sp. AS-PWVM4]
MTWEFYLELLFKIHHCKNLTFISSYSIDFLTISWHQMELCQPFHQQADNWVGSRNFFIIGEKVYLVSLL